MITVGVGELKPRFSDILNEVRAGEEVVISYGRRKEKVAVLVPYEKYSKRQRKSKVDQTGTEPNACQELDKFAGTWINDAEFDAVIDSFDKVDEDMWQ